MTSELEGLLEVQAHDLALDRLRHRREALPERAQLDTATRELMKLDGESTTVQRERDEVAREEKRIDDEAQALGARAAEVEQKLYSGTVSSPRELQAMQADVEMLKSHRSDLEDRELEVMEQRETLDIQLTTFAMRRATLDADIDRLRAEISTAEVEIDAEAAVERGARDAAAEKLGANLMRDY